MSRHKYVARELADLEANDYQYDRVEDADYSDLFGSNQSVYTAKCEQCGYRARGYCDPGNGEFYCNECWDVYNGTSTVNPPPAEQMRASQSEINRPIEPQPGGSHYDQPPAGSAHMQPGGAAPGSAKKKKRKKKRKKKKGNNQGNEQANPGAAKQPQKKQNGSASSSSSSTQTKKAPAKQKGESNSFESNRPSMFSMGGGAKSAANSAKNHREELARERAAFFSQGTKSIDHHAKKRKKSIDLTNQKSFFDQKAVIIQPDDGEENVPAKKIVKKKTQLDEYFPEESYSPASSVSAGSIKQFSPILSGGVGPSADSMMDDLDLDKIDMDSNLIEGDLNMLPPIPQKKAMPVEEESIERSLSRRNSASRLALLNEKVVPPPARMVPTASKSKKSKKKSNPNKKEPPRIVYRGNMRLQSSKDRSRHSEMKDKLIHERLLAENALPASETKKEDGSTTKKDKSVKKKKNPKNSQKPHLNLVIVGHVDHGKSTLMGHLLYALGEVDSKQMHKYKKESSAIGKASFAWAWVLDSHEEERSRGITVDVSVNYFETSNRRITLLDSPGHKDFIPSMISGAAQADCAILVVSAVPNEFDSGFNKRGQTREHAILIRSLGVQQVIVAVNKMDLVEWKEKPFRDIQRTMKPFLNELGFASKKIRFCPVSGLNGENLNDGEVSTGKSSKKKPSSSSKTEKTGNIQFKSWYNGPSLVKMIDSFKVQSSLAIKVREKPFRMTVTDKFKDISLGGTIVTGKVISGALMEHEQILIQPSSLLSKVKHIFSVKANREKMGLAIVGDNIQISLPIKDDHDFDSIHVGDVICSPIHEPLYPCRRFKCKLVTMNDLRIPLCRGHPVIIHSQSVSCPGVVKKLHTLIDKLTGMPIQNDDGGKSKKRILRHIKANQAAMVSFEAQEDVNHRFCLDKFSDVKALGRVTIRKAGQTIAIGQVMEIYF